MPGAAAPRFALEAGFLILLAVVLGFADLSPVLIAVVMGLAWVLVSLIEYFAWRQGPRFPARFATATVPAARIEDEVAMPEPPPRPPQTDPPAPEEQTAVAPGPEAPPAEREDAPKAALEFEQEQRARHRLEPLAPRPRRRWVIFGPRERTGDKPGSREEES
jgi:type IV secretory pathway VirB10-like protein